VLVSAVLEELADVRRLLQEATARAEKAERERDATAVNMARHIEELALALNEARAELSSLRAQNHHTMTGGL